MKRTVLTAALLMLGITPALAEEGSGLYLGAGIGQFNVEIDDVDTIDDIEAAFDSDDTVYKLFAGWRFAPFIGIELDYMDLGSPEDTIQGAKVKTEINGFAPYVVGALPLGPVELFAKVGYYFYDVEISGQDVTLLDDSSEDFVYGGGVGLTLFDHLHARLEYELIDISEVDDANAIWLTGAWRF